MAHLEESLMEWNIGDTILYRDSNDKIREGVIERLSPTYEYAFVCDSRNTWKNTWIHKLQYLEEL